MMTRGREIPTILTVLDWVLFLAQLSLIVHILYQLRFMLGPGYYAARAEELILLLAIFCFLTSASILISLLAKSYIDEPRYRETYSEEVT
ncbi:MAG: hypothetical protein ACE5I5_15335 [Candidatus Heimdallarchaeota archaeon]